jgi:hypothetical protein
MVLRITLYEFLNVFVSIAIIKTCNTIGKIWKVEMFWCEMEMPCDSMK